MRTIKFRGKIVLGIEPLAMKKGHWVEGHYYEDLQDGVWCSWIKECDDILHYKVDKETVGQFTGLLDKNGTEIYEGDIIGCHNPDIKHLIFYNEKQGRFMAALNGDIDNDFVGVCGLDDSRWNASKEVIGNIHDTPELLKGGAE